MKKRLISFALVAISVFSLIGSSFAMEPIDVGDGSGGTSSIEPYSNRYYYVTEIDPTRHREQTVTVSEFEASLKDGAKTVLASGIATLTYAAGITVPSGSVVADIAAGFVYDFVQDVLDHDPFNLWGTYYLSIDYEKRYQVDRLDETNRHLESTYMITTATLYQNGRYIGTSTHRLRMK